MQYEHQGGLACISLRPFNRPSLTKWYCQITLRSIILGISLKSKILARIPKFMLPVWNWCILFQFEFVSTFLCSFHCCQNIDTVCGSINLNQLRNSELYNLCETQRNRAYIFFVYLPLQSLVYVAQNVYCNEIMLWFPILRRTGWFYRHYV